MPNCIFCNSENVRYMKDNLLICNTCGREFYGAHLGKFHRRK